MGGFRSRVGTYHHQVGWAAISLDLNSACIPASSCIGVIASVRVCMTLLDSSEGLGIQSDGGLISKSNYPSS